MQCVCVIFLSVVCPTLQYFFPQYHIINKIFEKNLLHVNDVFFVAIRRHFGKQMNKETKLRIHNITAKAVLKFGREVWALKKREEQRLEAAQMKFLRTLLGITKLDKEKNQCIRQKTGAKNIVKEIKQYQKRWLQHVQRWTQTDYQNKHYNINRKDEVT